MAALSVRGARHMLLGASASEPDDAAEGASLRQVLNFSGAAAAGPLMSLAQLKGPQGMRAGAGLRQAEMKCAGERIYHIVPDPEGKRATEYHARLARALALGAARGRVAKDR